MVRKSLAFRKSAVPWLVVVFLFVVLWRASARPASAAQSFPQQRFAVECPPSSFGVPWGVGFDAATNEYVQNFCAQPDGHILFNTQSNVVVASQDLLTQNGSVTNTNWATCVSGGGMYEAHYFTFTSNTSGASLTLGPVVGFIYHGTTRELQLAAQTVSGTGTAVAGETGPFYCDSGTEIYYSTTASGFVSGEDYYDWRMTLTWLR